MTFVNKKCWIMGASSGIGAALAKELARQGAIVALSARRESALREIMSSLDGTGHITVPCDVTKHDDVENAVAKVQAAFGNIDYAVVLAATYKPGPVYAITAEEARSTVEANLLGIFYCVQSLLPRLRAQKGGVLALCGSVAGYRGLPNAQPYSATKAAIINLAETLRLEEAQHGIDVRIINPGFVRTPMTDKNSFDMPMIIEPEEAARSLASQLAGNSFEISFPRNFVFLMKVLRLLPYALYFRIASKLK